MRTNLILFILLSFLISCTGNFVEDLPYSKIKEPILFKTLHDKVITRYANDNHNDYHVYGIVDDSEIVGWFVNSQMTPGAGEDGTDYIFDGGYFWPGNGSDISFYAYSPDTITLGINSVTTDFSNPSIEIEYKVPSTAQQDFTIAIPLKQNSGTVNLQFQHMLSKIVVNVALADALIEAGYSLDENYKTTLKVAYDINTINAVYDYSSTNTLPSWSDSPLSSSSDSIIYYGYYNSYMILPQSFTPTTVDESNEATIWGTCTLTLTDIIIYLTVNDVKTEVFNGDLFQYGFADNVISDNKFLPNKCYSLNFTINDLTKDTNNNLIFNGAVSFDPVFADWTTTEESLN